MFYQLQGIRKIRRGVTEIATVVHQNDSYEVSVDSKAMPAKIPEADLKVIGPAIKIFYSDHAWIVKKI